MAKKTARVDLSKVDRKKLHELITKRSKVLLVEPGDIYPNPYNKNKMGKQYFEALKANLANPNIGFTQPILVRPHTEKEGCWMIVDGEHRWKASKEIGYEQVPCINMEEMPEALAKYLMLEQNAVRGQTSDEDQKKILQEIEEDAEWKALMEDFDPFAGTVTDEPIDDAKKYEDEEEGGDKDENQSITLYLAPGQMETYRKIIGQLRLAAGITAESAVMRCIEHFAESTGFGEDTGDEGLDAKTGKPPGLGD